jgi:type I restriction enzyme R subunit
MRNFDYLKDKTDFADLYAYCNTAEVCQRSDPAKSAINSRCALEYIVKAIYLIKQWDIPEHNNLFGLVSDEDFKLFIGDDHLMQCLHFVRRIGNISAHTQNVTPKQSFFSLIDVYRFIGDVLMKLGVVDSYPPFDKGLIPYITPIHKEPSTATVPMLKHTQPYVGRLDTRLVVHPLTGISEAETRKLFIDAMLEEAGWAVADKDNAVLPSKACTEIELQGMPNPHELGFADYVLFGSDCKPLAVVEAKRTSADAIKGRNQAVLYADCIEKKYGIRPIIYYTNGYETFVIDGIYPSHKVMGFHTERDLELMIQRRGRARITDMNIDDNITNREYQKRAIKFVCERFNSKKRRALIVMATGTGKTRVAISLVELLQRNNWIKNVLFLADRTALVGQAKRNFVKLLPHETTCVLSEDDNPDMNARIMFSTYQTMINYIDREDKVFSIGRFDLVIIDEAHRSVFGKYGAIFDYFDSLLVGLTATPREDIDKNTFDLLEMNPDEENFDYEMDEAVHDRYLVDYRSLVFHSNIIDNGIKYDSLSEEEKQQMEKIWEYEKASKALDPETKYCRDINKSEIFTFLFNDDTIDKVLQDLMTKGLRIESGERLGKTIIFAYNHKHAVRIVERFKTLYPECGEDFCQLIDTYETYANDLLEQFEVNGHLPQIAVSVDMLDTGVDVTEILNLVFFKMVRSKIKFIQMIGRGTRLCPDLFGPGKDKECFYIFDYCNNFEFFNKLGKEAQPMPVLSLTERLFDVRVDIAVALQHSKYQTIPFAKKLHDELKALLVSQVGQLTDNLIEVRRHWEIVDKFRKTENWEYVSEVDALSAKEEIAPLLIQESDNEGAKKFDLLVLFIELSLLDEEVNADKCKQKVVDIAHALEDKASIPSVRNRLDTIKEVQTKAYWESLTLEGLEHVRLELRDLMQLLMTDKVRQFVVDIEDTITQTESTSSGVPEVMTYRQRVMDYIEKNKDTNPVLQKIMNLEVLTHEDMQALQHILWHELGTKDDYDKNATNIYVRNNVAAFIRTIMGINRQKALQKFTTLISTTNLNSLQESFLKSTLKYVCENGDMTKENLLNEPFSTYFTEGVFEENMQEVGEYVDELHKVITA